MTPATVIDGVDRNVLSFRAGTRRRCIDCGGWITLTPVDELAPGVWRLAWVSLDATDCTRPESEWWGHRPNRRSAA